MKDQLEPLRLGFRYLRSPYILASALKVPARTIRLYLGEFRRECPFPRPFKRFGGDDCKAAMLYAVCRILTPGIAVETGVGQGSSTAGILAALERNNCGRLYSVDLPGATYVTDGGSRWSDVASPDGPGWFVPHRLRGRWSLLLGASREVLPGLLRRVGRVDIFYHDSEHTSSNMNFEFDLGWAHLKRGGLLVADNINWSSSFADFCKRVDVNFEILFPHVGITRAPASAPILSSTV